jgi:hypothetical protein
MEIGDEAPWGPATTRLRFPKENEGKSGRKCFEKNWYEMGFYTDEGRGRSQWQHRSHWHKEGTKHKVLMELISNERMCGALWAALMPRLRGYLVMMPMYHLVLNWQSWRMAVAPGSILIPTVLAINRSHLHQARVPNPVSYSYDIIYKITC